MLNLYFRSLLMTQIPKNIFILGKHIIDIKKLSMNCSQSLSNVNFWPKASMQKVPTENCQIWNFLANCFDYISIKNLRKTLKLLKISRYWGSKETGTSYWQRTRFKDKIFFQKVKKVSKLDETRKLWYTVLRKFWLLLLKIILRRETGY